MEDEKTPIEQAIEDLENQIKELTDYLKPLKIIKESPKTLINQLKNQLQNNLYLNYTEAEVEFDLDFEDEMTGGIRVIINISIPLWKQYEVNRELEVFTLKNLEKTQFLINIEGYEFCFDVSEIYEDKLLITGY